MARSNGLYFEVLDRPPLENVGFEVRVLSKNDFEKLCWAGHDTGDPLAIISRFIDVTFSIEISGVGAGSVTLDLDDDLWSQTLADNTSAMNLLEYEHIWQVFENGILRQAFLGQQISEPWLSPEEKRLVTVSGPGLGDTLKWARVMTPFYPNPRPAGSTESGVYQFKRISAMGAYLYLMSEAHRRGTIKFLCPSFTAENDSDGVEWIDKPPPEVPFQWVDEILSGSVTFASDSYVLTNTAAGRVAGLTGFFKHMPAPQITVVGHTDSTNTAAYNQTLSVNRANAVRNLIKQLVPHAIVNAYGRGETQPIASNNTAWGREQNRRVVITYPKGDPPPPEPYYTPPLGANLLDLLNELTGYDPDQPSPVRAEWLMRPNFVLDVRRQFGGQRDEQVIFYEASFNTITKSRERSRADIANLIAVQSAAGVYAIATDPTSVARWRQRENYTRQAASFDDTARLNIAQTMLEQNKTERSSWTIKVPPYAEGRTIFQDYNIGDWIGVSRFLGGKDNAVESFRVMAITLRAGVGNKVDLELTLQSKEELYARRIAMKLTSLLNHEKQERVEMFVQDTEPVTAKIGDLWIPLTED